MTFAAVSKHIKVLEQAGLVSRGREAQWRPCRLEAAPLRDVTDWLEDYRRFWDESVDRLEAYLKRLQAAERKPSPTTTTDPATSAEETTDARPPPIAARIVTPPAEPLILRRPGGRRAARAGVPHVRRPGAPGAVLGAARLDDHGLGFDFRPAAPGGWSSAFPAAARSR